VRTERREKPPPFLTARPEPVHLVQQIAVDCRGTARRHSSSIASLNVRDFARFDVPILNTHHRTVFIEGRSRIGSQCCDAVASLLNRTFGVISQNIRRYRIDIVVW